MDEDPDFSTRTHPEMEELKKLFLRQNGKMYDSKNTSVLFLFFAQWFTDSFLRTDFNDHKRTDSNHEIDFCALYGMTEEKTNMLRHPDKKHLMNFSVSDKGTFLPKLYEIEDDKAVPDGAHYKFNSRFQHNCVETEGWQKISRYLHDPRMMARITNGQDPEKIAKYYATGLEHGNGTLGYVVLNTLMMRAHNKIAEAIMAAHGTAGAPEMWTNTEAADMQERVFHTARNVMIVILLKIVIEDYVAHIAGRQFKTLIGTADKAPWGKQNHIAIEFNLLYRWHSLVPDKINVPDGELDDTGFLRNPGNVETYGLEQLLTGFSKQRAGRMGLRNHPAFFDNDRTGKGSTLERTLSKVMRGSKLRSMNEYRTQFGLKTYTSFEELVGEQEDKASLIKALKSNYKSVHDIEWFVGLFAEKHAKGKIMGELMLNMVANDAFTQALSNPLLATKVFYGDKPGSKGQETFSATGVGIIDSISSLQDLSDYVLGTGSATCTFHVTK